MSLFFFFIYSIIQYTNLDLDEERDDPDKDGDFLPLRLSFLHDLVLEPDLDEADDELDLLRLCNLFPSLDLTLLPDLAGDGDFDADRLKDRELV